jgi:tetratricopeptide (TPR) repeat protein
LERLYSEKSMVEAARLQFEKAARQDPQRLQVLDKILSSGRLSATDRTERLAEKAKLTEDLYDALHHLGVIYTRMGRFDDSQKVLEEAVKWKPGGAATQIELAKLFLRMGNRTKAQSAFRAALVADPVNKEAQAELWKLLNRP